MQFFECFAKNNNNVNEAFQFVIDEIVDVYHEDRFEQIKDNNVKVSNNNKTNICCKWKNKKNIFFSQFFLYIKMKF